MRVIDYKLSDRVLLFDLSNIAYISYHAHKNMMFRGNPSGHVFGFFSRVVDLVRRNPYADVGLVFAADGFPKRKKDLYPEYKAGRHTDDDFNPKPDALRLVSYFNCTVLVNDNEEADDLIASFCYDNRHRKITIVSSDQDLWQLLELENVRQWNPMLKKYANTDDLYEKYGIMDWYKIVMWKSLFGDRGDNIKPAAPRLRKKLVVPLINDCDGSIRDLYRLVEQNQHEFTPNMYQKVMDARQQLEENGRLVDLDCNAEYCEIQHKGNRRFLEVFLKKHNCNYLISDSGIVTGEN